MNLSLVLSRAAAQWPSGVALVDLDAPGGRREFTYEEFDVAVRRTAAGLRALGLSDGDRVAMLLPNSWEFVQVFMAVAAAGGVAVPLNTRVLADEHAHMVADCGARLLVGDGALLEQRQSVAALPDLGAVAVRLARPPEPGVRAFESLAAEGTMESIARAPSDLASIFYTSGTTGKPKGVMLSHQAWMAIAGYARSYLRYADGEVTIHLAPLTHGSGFLLLPTIAVGGTALLCSRFEPSRALDLFSREGVTNGFFVPSMIRMLLDSAGSGRADAPSLRSLYYAGSSIDPDTLRAALLLFGPVLIQSFGQAEIPMFVTVLDHQEHARIAKGETPHLMRSAGRRVDGAEVRIVDDDDRDLPVGEVGEIVARGAHMMTGYWNRPDATADTLRGGWVHTGDVGRFDDAGYLYIVDRKKDMIISGGSNVYAREVEEALLAMDSIREVAVIGLPHPKWGEMVTAVLVSRTGQPVDDDAMEAFCRASLPDYRRPKRFFWIDELPRNSYGKVLKRELRTRFTAAMEHGR